MKTAHRRPAGPHPSQPAGFTLFTVLLAVSVMAGLVVAYGRHVVVSGRGGMASPPLLAAREACHSGLAFARQAMVAGKQELPSTIPVGDALAGLSVAETPSGHAVMSVESFGGDGLGARRQAELALRPSPVTSPADPSSLPTLDAGTVAALKADKWLAVQHVKESARIDHEEVTGLLVVHPGVELQLADVVLHGAVISSSVLDQDTPASFDPDAAPRLLVDGNLRIDPPIALPGVAILMPEGTVASSAVDARIQIHGDVVACEVSLLHKGVFSGQVAGVHVALADSVSLDRLGFDRKPPEWSPSLQLGGASEPVFLAAVPASTDVGSLSPIIDYWTQDGP